MLRQGSGSIPTFFQMIGLHNQIVESIMLGNLRGRRALSRMKAEFAGSLREEPADDVAVNDIERLNEQVIDVAEVYSNTYQHYETSLGHYFRNLYRIVKFVDEAEIDDPRTYIGILRAQLSVSELALVLYNMFGHGYTKFLPLAEKHELFQNLPVSELSSPKHIQLLRAKRAHRGGKWIHLEGEQ